ncbi:MAG: hypothetical protein JXB23_12635 [Candidatus Aminicenantes bacterium]|nr:hypothetical protein [Candidatus Aminicenantes bacterium]
MGKFLVIVGGLILMAGGVYLAVFVWWREFCELIFGSVPILLFLVGFIAFIAGISSIKDALRVKNLEEEAVSEAIEKETVEESEQEAEEI